MKKFLFVFFAAALLFSIDMRAQRTVTGQVVGDDGMPVISAAVMVAGTDNGVVTDIDGKYTIKKVKIDDVLIFNCLGYAEPPSELWVARWPV